jgi:hypothetical protein
MAQGKSVHDDLLCHQEGFESEFYGHVSFGKGLIGLSRLAETFRSCPVSRGQYASNV